MTQQRTAPHSCPLLFKAHKALCEEFSVPRTVVRPFVDVVRAAAVDGHVVMTVASFDYAEGGVAWYLALKQQGITGGVVVALDLGAYVYLTNRGVPAVLLQTQLHLAPCCLHRFRMAAWRATNDVKVCVPLCSLRMCPLSCRLY